MFCLQTELFTKCSQKNFPPFYAVVMFYTDLGKVGRSTITVILIFFCSSDDGPSSRRRSRATAERGQPAGPRPLRDRHHLSRLQHP
jgi:hypothetical protein